MKPPFKKYYSGSMIILISFLLLTSCYTTKYVDNLDEPIYKERQIPVTKDVEKTEYHKMGSILFVNQSNKEVSKPISLAILDFYRINGTQIKYFPELTNSFFTGLKKADGFYSKFQPYTPKTLKEIFELPELNPTSEKVIGSLAKHGIPFAVTAKVLDQSRPEFEIYVIRTKDNKVIFTHLLKNTSNSEAIKDAVRLLMKEEVTWYTTVQETKFETKRELVGYEQKMVSVEDKNKEAKLWGWLLVLGLIGLAVIIAN